MSFIFSFELHFPSTAMIKPFVFNFSDSVDSHLIVLCKLDIFVLQQQQNLGQEFGISKMHLSPPARLTLMNPKMSAIPQFLCLTPVSAT